MIESISIDNYALIDKSKICPSAGFNVITGETGAGKSIMLGAIGLSLGERADTSVIGDRKRKCVVEMTYDISMYKLQQWFDDNSLDYADKTIVRREITPDGKSRGFINDTPVNNKCLKEFGDFLVDIHSQYQSLLLGKPEFQIEILDTFCHNQNIVDAYSKDYLKRQTLQLQIKNEAEKLQKALAEKDYLNFRYAQLTEAGLKEGEHDNLEAEYQLLSNANNIKGILEAVTYTLRDDEQATILSVKKLKDDLQSIENVLKPAEELSERLKSVLIELQDIADEAEKNASDINCEPSKLTKITERLDELNDLFYKFHVSDEKELLAEMTEISSKLKVIDSGEETLNALKQSLKDLETQMFKTAKLISESREKGGKGLHDGMNKLLSELGIKHAQFIVQLKPTETLGQYGTDEISFLFAANKNQEPGDIAKVASGGEMSRVMLSLKYILSQSKHLPAIIFDEIDTGVSGDIAHKMASMMSEMASSMQVISISHLPQIAAAADTQFKVYKEDSADRTVSKIKKLAMDERVEEIAAMISGSSITQESMNAAKSLMNL